MKKIFTLGLVLMMGAMSAMAQEQLPTDQMMKEWRQTIQKRDVAKKHLETNIPMSPTAMPKSNIGKA